MEISKKKKILACLLLIFLLLVPLNKIYIMPNDELEQKIEELSNKLDSQAKLIQTQGEQLSVLSSRPTQISRYLDNQSKDILAETISDRLFNISWNDYFFYTTNFESGDGFAQGGLPTFDQGGALLTTSASSGTSAYVQRDLTLLTAIDFKKESRFRTRINISTSSTSREIEFGIGGVSLPDLAGHAYGFGIDENAITGIAQTSTGARTTVPLGNITNGDNDFEAVFHPGQRVDFYVNKVLKGSITTTLPSATPNNFFTFLIRTNSAASKSYAVYGFDFRQKQL